MFSDMGNKFIIKISTSTKLKNENPMVGFVEIPEGEYENPMVVFVEIPEGEKR